MQSTSRRTAPRTIPIASRSPINVVLAEYQQAVLADVEKITHLAPNAAVVESVGFAYRCAKRGLATRFVLRNDVKKIQKDVYLGTGVTLDYLDYGPGAQRPARVGQPVNRGSFQISELTATPLNFLIKKHFADSPAPAISRAIWLYREVLVHTEDRSKSWKFGLINSGGRFVRLSVRRRNVPVAAEALAGVREVWGRTLRRKGVLGARELRRVREFFECGEIPPSQKIHESNLIVAGDSSLLATIYHLGATLGLTLEEAKQIRLPETLVWSNPESLKR